MWNSVYDLYGYFNLPLYALDMKYGNHDEYRSKRKPAILPYCA